MWAIRDEKASGEGFFFGHFWRLESLWSLRPEIGTAAPCCWKEAGVLGFAAERWFMSVRITRGLPLWSLALCC